MHFDRILSRETALSIWMIASVTGCYRQNRVEEGDPDGGDVDVIDPPAPQVGDAELCDPDRTCASLAQWNLCIADFSQGTGKANLYGAYDPIGFYAFHDDSQEATMIPAVDHTGPCAVEWAQSCSRKDNWVLHMKGGYFSKWGAGVGMNWGGPKNPACEVPGAMECLALAREDPHISVEGAGADPRCDTQTKIDCLKFTDILLQPRDLTSFRGIGFWVLWPDVELQDSDAVAVDKIMVSFPIPDTTRFLGACNDEDESREDKDCSNHFNTVVSLLQDDIGRWIYKEVLFEDLAVNYSWGYQPEYRSFPKEKSLGILFHIPSILYASTGAEYFDFYIDDIVLLR